MQLHRKRSLGLSAGLLMALSLLVLSCFCPRHTWADEWNDTFNSPREFIVNQNMTARKGPGNNFEAMGIVPQGTSVWVTSITNGWHCFKLVDGRSAYIYRRYLDAKQKNGKKAAAEKKDQTEKSGKQSASSDKQKAKQPQKKTQPVKKAEEPRKTVASESSEYDDPIVDDKEPPTSGTGQKEEFDEPLVNNEPEPPLLAQIPQGPEDEPAAPDNLQKTADADEADDAVEPEKRPVRSSSFGNDGCESYQRIAFTKQDKETLLKGKAVAGKQICYRFLGIEGNTVSLGLEPAGGAAVFDVYTPASGHVAEKQHAFSWRCVSTGDKIIVVHARKSASFSLKVKMQP